MAEHRVTSFILLYVSVTDSENATNRTNASFGLLLCAHRPAVTPKQPPERDRRLGSDLCQQLLPEHTDRRVHVSDEPESEVAG